MSDLFENQSNELKTDVADETVSNTVDTINEESTIFSAPVEHKAKLPVNAGKKRITSIIAACVAVAVLVGGTIAIIKLIPEMKGDETVSSVFEDIAVVDADSNAFTAVTVNNKNGEFKFVTQQLNGVDADGKEEVTTYWTVEGIDVSKLSTTTTNTIIKAAADVVATREIDTKTPSECGFEGVRPRRFVQ